jgi:hypothetical protein
MPPLASRSAPGPTLGTAGKGKSGAVGRGLKGRGVTQSAAGVMGLGIGVKTITITANE